ncbi:MAG: hypothetical protein DI538_07300 [Azospira oryzae]|nr:MAG: hypothetical protein DI538_07300 [Azospira oryzae]
MNRLKNYFFLLLFSSLLLLSCSDDKEEPKGEFSSGVWVVNEGAYKKSDGSVSYYNPSSSEVKQDVFGQKNNGRALGDVVQSVAVDGDLAYIVVNNDNKMEVVNANTFVSEYTLANLKLPRYFTTFGGKGYLTEWVSFSDPGRVSVINLTTHTVETTITTDSGAENIIAANNLLFVSNNFTNTVSVIDPTQNKVIKTITVSDSPNEFVLDSEGKLWLICSGAYQADNAVLYKINTSTYEIEKKLELGMGATQLAINKAKNLLYFISGTNVYKVSTQSPAVPTSAFFAVSTGIDLYSMDVDPDSDMIYIGDANGFQINGNVYRYDSDGKAKDSFGVGKGPNGFVFR